MGDSPRQGSRSATSRYEVHAPVTGSRSFAELLAAMHTLNGLEAALATVIARARVPIPEVRGPLRSQTPDQAENGAAFQFMRELFAQVGIPLAVSAVGRFSVAFEVDASPYAQLFAGSAQAKTCGFVSAALSGFLAAGLALPAEVDEVACRNEGAARCRFSATLDPDAVRHQVLDLEDWGVLQGLAREDRPGMGMPREEWDYRMERLMTYGLVNAEGELLPAGQTLAREASPPPEDSISPPWQEVSRLTGAIAHARSAAEALVEVAPRDVSDEVVVDEETAALAAECHSFAELLARASKRRSWE